MNKRAWSLSACSLLLMLGCGPSTGPAAPQTGDSSASTGGDSNPAGASGPLSSGPKSPDFTLPTLDGDSLRLSDHLGKDVVLIDFWSTTCDPCMVELPHIVRMYEDHKDKGFVVLAISLDGPETRAQVTSVVHDKEMSFPVLLDSETSVVGKFNPKNELPYAVLINRRGEIVYQHGGYTPGDEVKLREHVERIVSE